MLIRAQARCELCGHEVARVDEHERCEQCVLRASSLAEELLCHLEELVRSGLESGLTQEQLREAFDLSLTDAEGELPELSLIRVPVAAQVETAWLVAPHSAWLDYDSECLPNRIRRLRRTRAMSVETLAERLGVSVSELALWEHTPEVPHVVVEELAEVFGVSVPHLMKTDMDWLHN